MKRILLIRLGAMGDIVLATAAVEALARAFPGAVIDFLLKARFAGLLEGNPRIAGLLAFDDRGRHRGTRGLMTFMREIQPRRYDLAVDLQDNLRSRLICAGLRAPKVLRWDKRAWRRRMILLRGTGGGAGTPVYGRYLESLKPLGIDISGSTPKLYPVAGRIPEGLDKPFMAMAPGAHWPAKRWPAGHYAELAKLASGNAGLRIVVVGSDEDRQACETVQGACPSAMNLCGRLDLGSLAAVLSKAKVLVTNDTGPMHMAEAVGVPVLAFFGPTVPEFGFAPWRPESRMLQKDLDCRPCSLHGRRSCRRGDHRCLEGILPEEAWKTLGAMLDG